MLTLVDRGADFLAAAGATQTLVDALKEEARRVEENIFFGFIAFLSLIAGKPHGEVR